MELRKCECGTRSNPKPSACSDKYSIIYAWEVYCNKCDKSTALHKTEHEAIQAWNEGKVG